MHFLLLGRANEVERSVEARSVQYICGPVCETTVDTPRDKPILKEFLALRCGEKPRAGHVYPTVRRGHKISFDRGDHARSIGCRSWEQEYGWGQTSTPYLAGGINEVGDCGCAEGS